MTIKDLSTQIFVGFVVLLLVNGFIGVVLASRLEKIHKGICLILEKLLVEKVVS